jgi:hypothetical protein
MKITLYLQIVQLRLKFLFTRMLRLILELQTSIIVEVSNTSFIKQIFRPVYGVGLWAEIY